MELVLFDAVMEPVELHVDGFESVLSNGRADDAVGSTVVSLKRGWRLWMTKFCKCGLHWVGVFAINAEGSNFCFGG